MLLAIVVLVAVGLAYVVSNETASVLTSVAGFALVGLSVGLLTGTSGQLSLGQFAYAGIGAATSVHVMAKTENFVLGMLAGIAAAALASALVGIPALRLKGLALAVSTLAFALATTAWLLRLDLFLGDGVQPPKPSWFGYDLVLAKDYYLFALLMLALGIWVTGNLRRSGFGLSLQALRDNEDAARAFTVPSRRRKLQLYAVSGAIAGLGGAVIGHSQTQLTVNSFPAAASIDVVALTVIGGLGVTAGPVIGALMIVGLPGLIGFGLPGQAALAVGWLLVVVFLPDGLGGVLVTGPRPVGRRDGPTGRPRPVAARGGGGARPPSPLHVRARLDGLGTDLPPARRSRRARCSSSPTSPGTSEASSPSTEWTSRCGSGEILGVIGPNGAGKTTVFEIVAGFTAPDTGQVVLRRDPTSPGRVPGGARPRRPRAVVPGRRAVPDPDGARDIDGRPRADRADLAVERRARARCSPTGRRAARADELMERMGLAPYSGQMIAELSTGTRRVVEIACLLTLEPSVLLLDEPSAGIAQAESEALGDLLLGHPRAARDHDGRHRARPPSAVAPQRPDGRDEPGQGHRHRDARRGASPSGRRQVLPRRRVGHERGRACAPAHRCGPARSA